MEIRHRIGAAAAAALLAAGSLVTTAPNATAATTGISVWNACVYQHGTPSFLRIAPYNVMGWQCVYYGGWNEVVFGVDLNRECRRIGYVAARYTNFNNPYSWYCYR